MDMVEALEKPGPWQKKQQSHTPSPARKQRKLVSHQSNSETCTTSSEVNSGSKQRAPQNAHKKETIVEQKTNKSKTKAMKKSNKESLLQSLQCIDKNIL